MAGYRQSTPDPSKPRKRRGGQARRRFPAGTTIRKRQQAARRDKPRALAEQRLNDASDPLDKLAVAYAYVRSAATKRDASSVDLERAARMLMQVGHRTYGRAPRPAADIRTRRVARRASRNHRR